MSWGCRGRADGSADPLRGGLRGGQDFDVQRAPSAARGQTVGRTPGDHLTVERAAELTTFRVLLPLDGPGRDIPVTPEGLTAAATP